jgi:hypothetical protein
MAKTNDHRFKRTEYLCVVECHEKINSDNLIIRVYFNISKLILTKQTIYKLSSIENL